jgi:hypothetical protein
MNFKIIIPDIDKVPSADGDGRFYSREQILDRVNSRIEYIGYRFFAQCIGPSDAVVFCGGADFRFENAREISWRDFLDYQFKSPCCGAPMHGGLYFGIPISTKLPLKFDAFICEKCKKKFER